MAAQAVFEHPLQAVFQLVRQLHLHNAGLDNHLRGDHIEFLKGVCDDLVLAAIGINHQRIVLVVGHHAHIAEIVKAHRAHGHRRGAASAARWRKGLVRSDTLARGRAALSAGRTSANRAAA